MCIRDRLHPGSTEPYFGCGWSDDFDGFCVAGFDCDLDEGLDCVFGWVAGFGCGFGCAAGLGCTAGFGCDVGLCAGFGCDVGRCDGFVSGFGVGRGVGFGCGFVSGFGFVPGLGLVPVSYTHLDVYKRQERRYAMGRRSLDEFTRPRALRTADPLSLIHI